MLLCRCCGDLPYSLCVNVVVPVVMLLSLGVSVVYCSVFCLCDRIGYVDVAGGVGVILCVNVLYVVMLLMIMQVDAT